MTTRIDEIADGIFRISTFVEQIAPPHGFVFNQFLVAGEEPLLFHTGQRRLFPAVHEAVGRVIAPESLRWISFGHFEADECGAMNLWLEAAPNAEIVHGDIGCAINLNDMADRAPRVSLHPAMGATIRRLAPLGARTLGLMHGPSFAGDTAAALEALADDYDRRSVEWIEKGTLAA